jgi:hypothetical protein
VLYRQCPADRKKGSTIGWHRPGALGWAAKRLHQILSRAWTVYNRRKDEYNAAFDNRTTGFVADYNGRFSGLKEQVKRFIIPLLGIIYPANAQIEHGSVGIIYYTNEKIVIAADSRGVKSRGSQKASQDDTVCKIFAPDGKIVFVATGNVNYTSAGQNDPVRPWMSSVEVRRAYHNIVAHYGTPRGHVQEIAREWGRIMQEHFAMLYAAQPTHTASLADPQTGIITAGIFGGFAADGRLGLFVARVVINPSSPTPVSSMADPVHCPNYNFCAMGRAETFTEFVKVISERAREEKRTWVPASPFLADRDILQAKRFVELTIKYSQEGDVGGPVDAVELRKDGSLHWNGRKQNCPVN